MRTRIVRATSPYGRAVAKERARLETLLAERTLPDGTGRAKPGLRLNVMRLRTELAKLPVVANDPA